VRTLGTITVFLLLLGLGGSAAAQGNPTDALIEQASAKYADLDFEAAIPFLERAYQQPGNSRCQVVRIFQLGGLCFGSLGKYDLAKDVFRRALTLDPSFRLGSDVSPRVRAPFDSLLQAPPARLDVQIVAPPFAELNKPVVFTAKVASDDLKLAKIAKVFFRRGSQGGFSSVKVPLSGPGQVPITIAPSAWQLAGSQGPLFWYAVVENENQAHMIDTAEESRVLSLEVYDKPPPKGPVVLTEETPWYAKWWVWALVGGAVAAGTTTAVILATQKPSGPFDFTVDFR
jgi:tetratricopeptide (TPR) repeat protein